MGADIVMESMSRVTKMMSVKGMLQQESSFRTVSERPTCCFCAPVKSFHDVANG